MPDIAVEIWVAIIGVMGIMFKALIDHHKDLKKQRDSLKGIVEKRELQLKKAERLNREYEIKISFFDRIMDFTAINNVKESVDRMFRDTKADRFLILIAVNGKEDFNMVSVIFEQHKTPSQSYNAIGRYHNVKIDNSYRQMLKRAENEDHVLIDTKALSQCLLKDIYNLENVKHAMIRHLARKPIGDEDDFLVYSSIATHSEKKFTREECTIIKTEYEGVILESIKEVLN